MEDIMQPSLLWKLQTHSHVIDDLGDAVRPQEPGLELARDGLRQGRGWALAKVKKCPVTHLVSRSRRSSPSRSSSTPAAAPLSPPPAAAPSQSSSPATASSCASAMGDNNDIKSLTAALKADVGT